MQEQKNVPNWGQTVYSTICIFNTETFTTVIPLPQPLNENEIAYCGVAGYCVLIWRDIAAGYPL